MEVNNNGEPVISIELSGQEKTMTWISTCIYTHLKLYSQFDHIFVSEEPPKPDGDGFESALGNYIFRQVVENFDEVVDFLDDYNFPHVHKPYPAPTDVEVYINAAEKDIDNLDQIIEYWENE